MRMALVLPFRSNSGMDIKTIRRVNLHALKKIHRTWEAMADLTGVPASYLSQCAGGYRDLGNNNARKIETALGKPTGWFDSVIDGTGGEPFVPYQSEDKYVYIPVYAVKGALGKGIMNGHEEISGKHSYSQSWLLSEGLEASKLSRMKGVGRSMEPTIFDGDTLLVNHSEKTIIDGKVYVFMVDGQLRVKRLFRLMDGRVRVVSDNPDKVLYPDEYLSVNDMPELIGRVRDRSGTTNL